MDMEVTTYVGKGPFVSFPYLTWGRILHIVFMVVVAVLIGLLIAGWIKNRHDINDIDDDDDDNLRNCGKSDGKHNSCASGDLIVDGGLLVKLESFFKKRLNIETGGIDVLSGSLNLHDGESNANCHNTIQSGLVRAGRTVSKGDVVGQFGNFVEKGFLQYASTVGSTDVSDATDLAYAITSDSVGHVVYFDTADDLVMTSIAIDPTTHESTILGTTVIEAGPFGGSRNVAAAAANGGIGDPVAGAKAVVIAFSRPGGANDGQVAVASFSNTPYTVVVTAPVDVNVGVATTISTLNCLTNVDACLLSFMDAATGAQVVGLQVIAGPTTTVGAIDATPAADVAGIFDGAIKCDTLDSEQSICAWGGHGSGATDISAIVYSQDLFATVTPEGVPTVIISGSSGQRFAISALSIGTYFIAHDDLSTAKYASVHTGTISPTKVVSAVGTAKQFQTDPGIIVLSLSPFMFHTVALTSRVGVVTYRDDFLGRNAHVALLVAFNADGTFAEFGKRQRFTQNIAFDVAVERLSDNDFSLALTVSGSGAVDDLDILISNGQSHSDGSIVFARDSPEGPPLGIALTDGDGDLGESVDVLIAGCYRDPALFSFTRRPSVFAHCDGSIREDDTVQPGNVPCVPALIGRAIADDTILVGTGIMDTNRVQLF